MPTSVRAIARALHAWAPPGSAQDYDNVGLQVGRADASVARVLLALDCTPQVLREAQDVGADLIVTHHPLIFRPLTSVTAADYPSSLALRLAEAGIGLFSIHTNLDAAPGGVSFALAEHLGLQEVSFLDGFPETLYKLTTFVPAEALEDVRSALADAGAGRIGDYDACAFATKGTGYFRPHKDADPHTGTPGTLSSADEYRLEAEVARWTLGAVLDALRAAHPYEEVAYDVYPVQQKNTQAGLGAVGHLDEAMPLRSFLARVADRLDAGSLRYAGDPAASVQRVAVCGGAGSDFVGQAQAAGADAYVTADVTYHTFFDVLDTDGAPAMALIDAGHYETEALTEALLRDWLAARFPDVAFRRTETRTSPMRTFVP
ncbi:Nif3-like dinuclear metal center hexameric protein [Salisaeta longa]|uniref:Nif3-like dinuclear metal center hexameric protein n=1 Tax=Salisaeta longa TaxID=503170 RepID=UPI00041A70EE|nr:Nif3-like dinuclear metal center hexameric protein [Salisaeta longa]